MKNKLINGITGCLRRTTFRVIQVLFVVLAQLLAPLAGLHTAQPALAAGGDFSIDFAAAAPFTYDHLTGGGAFNDGTIGKANDVVESLEGGDFACGETVTYLTQIRHTGPATDDSQTLELQFSFLANTTGQPGAAHSDVTYVGVNYGTVQNGAGPGGTDSGLIDDGGSTATIVSEYFVPSGTTPFNGADELILVVRIDDLEAGEEVILRIDTALTCDPGSGPTGNLQAQFNSGRVVAINGDTPADDSLTGGEQTIPFKQIGDLAGAGEPLLVIVKTVTTSDGLCPGVDTITVNEGDTVKYCYSVSNPGTADLFDVEVIDDNGTLGDPSDDFTVSLSGLADLDGDADLGDLVSGGTATGEALVTLSSVGTVVNTATATGNNGKSGGNLEELTDSDDATVIVQDVQPTATLTKTADPTEVTELDGNVTFSIAVQNTSTVESLTLSALSDDIYGNIADPANPNIVSKTCSVPQTLDPDDGAEGGTDEYSCEFVAFVGGTGGDSQTDIVTGTLSDDDGNSINPSDDATVTITVAPNPALSLVKEISISSTGPWFDSIDVLAGDDVYYRFTVQNTGNVDLTGITINDPDLDTSTCSFTDPLAPTATTECVVGPITATAGTHTNTATASGGYGGQTYDSNQDSATYFGANLDYSIVKTITAVDAAGDGVINNADEIIEYQVVVSNDGNVDLTGVSVSDSLSSPGSPTESMTADGILEVGETWTYSYSYTVTQSDLNDNGDGDGDIDNTATVSSPELGDERSRQEQPVVQNPTIDLIKENGTFNDDITADGFAEPGVTISYDFTITNDGNVTLSNVVLSDPSVTVDCGLFDGTLDPGESVDCTGSYTLTQTDIDAGVKDNLATVNGVGPQAQPVEASDDESVLVPQNPAISIIKTTADDYDNEGDALGILPGENVTWNYVVTNDGNVTLSNVSVTDDQLVVIDCVSFDGTLDPGESVTCTATGTAQEGWYNNWGTVTGEGPQDQLVDDADPSSYYGLTPGAVTNSSLCDFGDQFRLIVTPDMQRFSSSTPFYKLSDSNPGQFFYNVFYVNDGSTETITMEIPYPFVTQGANPVHVYGGLFVNPEGSGGINCFEPYNELASYGFTITLTDYNLTNDNFVDNGDGVVGYGDAILVDVSAEFGFQYINLHLDYGLEKTRDWEKKGANVVNDGLSDPSLTGIAINDNTAHTFSAYADGALIDGSTDTVYNLNEFKQIRGFGGIVQYWNGTSYEALQGAQVQLIGPNGAEIETMTTDDDGWYLSDYIHKGKAADYTLKLVSTGEEIVVNVGGKVKFGEGNFLIP